MINQNSEILNKLFFTELQILVEKYNKIDEVTKKKIESIITKLKGEELQSYLMNNPNKLLWNNCQVVLEDNCWNKYVEFGIKLRDFLLYVKDGFKDKSNKGMINTLSNYKRAIDCQIDWILSYLGYDYLNTNHFLSYY